MGPLQAVIVGPNETVLTSVHRLARDDQPHDLRGSLEDAIDAHVPQHLLGGHATLAARGQGRGGLIAAATAEAEGFECVLADAKQVKNLPGRPKRDPSDSRWLAACFERGAVTPCFVATPEFRIIRLHTRYRRS